MNLLANLFHPHQNRHPVRFAVVGLGNFAQTAILPAFANAEDKAELAALVTGDVEKAAKLSRKYKVTAYAYDDYEELLHSGKIEAVYIAVPNSEHRTYAEPAARAGVHVLCEKPLAYSVEDARAIVNVCQKHKVRLMTAYRLHFEEGNLAAIEAAHSGKIGEPRLFTSVHTMQVEPDNIRVDLSLGGGPLEDIGIYCLNAARYIFKPNRRKLPRSPFAARAAGLRKFQRRYRQRCASREIDWRPSCAASERPRYPSIE